MLNWLSTNVASVRQVVTVEVLNFINRSFMEAVVAGCALMAHADRENSDNIKSGMTGFFRDIEDLRSFDIQDVIDVFRKHIENFQLNTTLGKAAALQAIAKIKEHEGQSRILMTCICSIETGDSEIMKSVIGDICNELGLAHADFDF